MLIFMQDTACVLRDDILMIVRAANVPDIRTVRDSVCELKNE